MKLSRMAAYVIAAALVVTAARYGLPKALGAHPFWAARIAWIGVPAGLALAFVAARMGVGWIARIRLFLFLLAASAAAAHFGRLGFVASFAENRVAGRFWYFGWIGVACFAAALVVALLTPRAARHGRS